MNFSIRTSKSIMQMSRVEALDAFHAERSRCIDAFAAIEEVTISLMHLLDMKFGGEPFGHKLEALRKAKAGPRFSKARLQKLESLIPA